MFFEANVNAFTKYNCVYLGDAKDGNGKDVGPLIGFPPSWAMEVRQAILDGSFRDSVHYGACPSLTCPVMHLKGPGRVCGVPVPVPGAYVFDVAECACREIAAGDRHAITTMRSTLEDTVVGKMKEKIHDLSHATVTFWCSGRLLGELVTLIKVIDVIASMNKEEFALNVNFIDKEYSEYLITWFLENQLEGRRDTSIDGSSSTSTVCPALRHFFSKRLADNGRRIYSSAIANSLNLLNASLKTAPSIHMRARFFATDTEYEQAGEKHDVMIGHDIEATWEPMRRLHQSVGNTHAFAVAWSKRSREAVELKQMASSHEDWQTITEIPLLHSRVQSQASTSSSMPVTPEPSSSSSSSSSSQTDFVSHLKGPSDSQPISHSGDVGSLAVVSTGPSGAKPGAVPVQKVGNRRVTKKGGKQKAGRGGKR